MAVTPIPELDRTSPTFKTQVDEFFGIRIPRLVPELNVLQQDVAQKHSQAVAAAGSALQSKEGAAASAAVSAERAAVAVASTSQTEAARDTALEALDDVEAIATKFGNVDGAVMAATQQAGIATVGASEATIKAAAADASAARAEQAKDAAGVLTSFYKSFLSKAAMDADRNAVAGRTAIVIEEPGAGWYYKVGAANTGSWERLPNQPASSAALEEVRGVIDTSLKASVAGAIVDDFGNAVMQFMGDSSVEHSGMNAVRGYVPGWQQVVVDDYGYIVEGIRDDGTKFFAANGAQDEAAWATFGVAESDSIVFVGDSYTASHYTLKDKAYISLLSSMTRYRCRNFGISGDDAPTMNWRIVSNEPYADGVRFRDFKARYAFIATFTNDGAYRSADLTMFQANLERLVESVMAHGCVPIIVSEFPADPTAYQALRQVAAKYGARFVDGSSLNYEIGQLQVGHFHQGHPGTRTNGVFWVPMREALAMLPAPDQSIKVYRRRSGVSVSSVADLLTLDEDDRTRKFKELSITHRHLSEATSYMYDTLADSSRYNYSALTTDEYLDLEDGSGVEVADYALVEITLPGTAGTLEGVKLAIRAGAAQVYVRNWIDQDASIGGKGQGASPTQPDYLAKWSKPRGSWVLLGSGLAEINLSANLSASMSYDKIELLFHAPGGFTLESIQCSYKGGGKQKLCARSQPRMSDAQLLAMPTVDAASLPAWTVSGSVPTLVPVDNYNSPRKPQGAAPVDGVCVVSATGTISRSVSLPAPGLAPRTYAITVYARHFPKAFVDNSVADFDPAQVVDRIANPDSPTITPDTHDMRTLQLEYRAAATLTTQPGGAQAKATVGLAWMPARFYIEVPASPFGVSPLTFRLSCPDGELQIAKVYIQEVL